MSAATDMTNEESNLMGPVEMDLTCNVPPVTTSNQQTEVPGGAEQQTMRVYLRVRPFSKEERADNEDQDCVVIENSQTVTLNAPKGSATMKSSEKGIGMSLHKFSFSQIFGPEMTQSELFEHTVKSQMYDFLDGKNALIFSYGVTNAGKTYTIQGTPKDPGILPRVLDATFHYIGGHQYERMDLKPYLRNDAQYLDPDQVKQERSVKAAIFASVKEECDPLRASGGLESCSTSALSSSSLSYDQTMLASNPTEAGGSQFALWVAFFEIYNECVYDLLHPSLCSKSKKRAALRVCDDGAGNAYVKDLRWLNIQTLGEASKLLQFGNKNRSAAATKMNQSSSRSHSIFTMKLLKIDDSTVKRISEMKSSYIPFRESKLTKLFQAVFCGKGKASMIVNINQCASTYDETLHVMKFSAVAKQVVQVIPDKPVESLAPCMVGRDGKPLVRNGVIDSHALESYLSEEELLDEEDEADMSLLPQNELLNMIETLRAKLLAERRKNLVQEMEIRKEMGDAMLQQIMESEELRSRQMEELKESYQEKLENTFEMYKDAIKEHAYQSAMNNLEDDYVPLDEFIAEQEKVEVNKIHRTYFISKADDRCKWLYKEKCAIERMCEDKQQKVSDDFMKKSADLDTLQKKADDQKKSMDDILRQNIEKDREIASLKAELAKAELAKSSQKSPVQPKAKRGLLANIREAVTSPRKGTSGRTLRKTVRTAHH
ncbi:Kinesin-like protein KIF20A [Nibea albiflora]|uniref:Kinesin-like protein KIF20A n=1 Tax=Nibea albiflora TaxID=240163 RepID=A0ACB7F8I3_NIBAL|nr:Kinesin-like protein KIF20A [Nibea albiflora]